MHKNFGLETDAGSGFSGKQMEEDYLFPPGRAPREQTMPPPYSSLRQSIIDCVSHPQYRHSELSDPPALWMNDVHCLVAEELKLRDYGCLKVFPTLRTAADRYHGIDFILLYTDPATKKEVIVTVDLTKWPTKSETGYKADIIVSPASASANADFYDLEDGNSVQLHELQRASRDEDYHQRIVNRRQVAHLIAEVIKQKIALGDLHYPDLYDRRSVSYFLHHDIRSKVAGVLDPTSKPAQPQGAQPQPLAEAGSLHPYKPGRPARKIHSGLSGSRY